MHLRSAAANLSRVTPIGHWLRNNPRGSMYVNFLHYFFYSFLRASFGLVQAACPIVVCTIGDSIE